MAAILRHLADAHQCAVEMSSMARCVDHGLSS